VFRILILVSVIYVIGISDETVLPILSAEEKDVEIFVAGESFGSFDEYRLNKLEVIIHLLLESSTYDQFDIVLETLIQRLSKEKIGQLNSTDLEMIIQQWRSRETTVIEDGQAGDIAQMEEMLDKYKEEHGNIPSIKLDPEKIKTITISPSQ